MKRLSLLYFTIILTLGLVACGSDSSEPKPIDTEKKDDITDKIEPVEIEELVKEDEVEEVIDKKDIEAYLDEVKVAYLELISLSGRWDELREAPAAGEIEDSVFGDGISEEIIPANTVLVEKIEAIATPDDKTAKTNDVLMDAAANQLLAFTEIIYTIETGDSSKIASTNALLNKVRESDIEFAKRIDELITEYDINPG